MLRGDWEKGLTVYASAGRRADAINPAAPIVAKMAE